MSRQVFISYRRDDTGGDAGRMRDRLLQVLPGSDVFFDIGAIGGGEDFVQRIEKAIETCDAGLVFIGDRWLTAADAAGKPRLEDANDFVRLEVRTLLARPILTIPVLVAGAKMPSAAQLPPDLQGLATRNALPLRRESFDADAQALIDAALGVTPELGLTPARIRARIALHAALGALIGAAAIFATALIYHLATNASLAYAVGDKGSLALLVLSPLIGAAAGVALARRRR